MFVKIHYHEEFMVRGIIQYKIKYQNFGFYIIQVKYQNYGFDGFRHFMTSHVEDVI